MEIVLYSIFSGIIGGCISILFRIAELKDKTFYLGRQTIVQIITFLVFLEILKKGLWNYELSFGFLHINAFWLFLIINSLGYFLTKIIFESYSGISFLPADKEIEEYIKNNDDNI